jgi:DNA-binding MarR family transcriptional regulator
MRAFILYPPTVSVHLVYRTFRIAKDTQVANDRQTLIAAVGRATQAYQRATDGFDDEVGRALALNPSDLRCLDWLTERPMTAGELAVATGLSGAATTTLLDRLEQRGYVRRVRDTADRRKVLVELTPDGTRTIMELYGPLAAEGPSLLSRFTDRDLALMRDFLVEATDVTDRHRTRLRDSSEGRTRRPLRPRNLAGRARRPPPGA